MIKILSLLGSESDKLIFFVISYGDRVTIALHSLLLQYGLIQQQSRQIISYSPLLNLSSALGPCSNHSSLDIQNSSRFFMISASTAPPKKTICFLRGGSSILILNFCVTTLENGDREEKQTWHTLKREASPFRTRVKYSCFISFSRRLGRPGYILEPPESTMCLYSSARTSTAACWIVPKSSSVWWYWSDWEQEEERCIYLPRQEIQGQQGGAGTCTLVLQIVPSQPWLSDHQVAIKQSISHKREHNK